jgi:hypothetical protein
MTLRNPKLAWIGALALAAAVSAVLGSASPQSGSSQSGNPQPGSTPPRSQEGGPTFRHVTHVVDNDVACESCHPRAATSTNTGDDLRPRISDCGSCHGEDAADYVTAYGFAAPGADSSIGEFPVWAGHRNEVRFGHQVHVQASAIACTTCHGTAAEAEPVLPTGQTCVRCHDGVRLSGGCEVCHATPIDRPPADHAGDWQREHARVWQATRGAACGHCHRAPDCQECHEAAGLTSTELLPREYFAPFKLSESRNESPALERVHALDFRFTHAFEAEGKESRCGVCHEITRDCSECHAEMDAAGDALHRPAWHGGADWGTAGGPGSGGGRHGELARRDVERCAACHDVEGADPVCMQCHNDLDGQRGTDPRLHPAGFKQSVGHGSFHSDDGAVCYFCHRRSDGGEGFCHYCHEGGD